MTQYIMMIYAPTEPHVADAAGTDVARWIEFDALLRQAGIHVTDHRLHDPA